MKDILKSKSTNRGKKNLEPVKVANSIVVIGLIIFLIISIICAVGIGSVKIPVADVYRIISYKIFGIKGLESAIQGQFVDIIWQIRLPRVLLGVVVGMGLALGGVVMQATVQNPLADPYILGISSGAILGATFFILVGSNILTGTFQSIGIAFWAFIGALMSSIMVFKLSSIGGRITSTKLVLSGMVVSIICSAFSSLMVYLTNDNNAVRSISEWAMGSLTGGKWSNLWFPTIITFILIAFFLCQYRIMNTMLLGDEAAITLGIDLSKYRKLYMIMVSILTGVLVSSCGIIGFIGLVIPHITRSLAGSNHKNNLPIATLIGGIFLVWADVLARIILKNMEMPIGIITSVIGAPFFIYIILKRAYSF
ncbi:FecCD family ABC transporter permease [Clostridium tetani]|uniref:FecCD family ABC transporter permease n=1 Tax=Clostridium tetani TaxID=1513 RepID=UPI000B256BAB|nr:iron ABC transporter permease [Clostridium tetani]SUY65993.1 iron ABC transporter permease [Clostridium tetani]